MKQQKGIIKIFALIIFVWVLLLAYILLVWKKTHLQMGGYTSGSEVTKIINASWSVF